MIVDSAGFLKDDAGNFIGTLSELHDDELVSEFIWRKTKLKRGDVFKIIFGIPGFCIYTGEGNNTRKVFLRQHRNGTWYKQTKPAANIRSKFMQYIGWLNIDQILTNEIRRLNAIY